MAWAACRTEDPELFFPVGTLRPAEEQTRRAAEVCRGCPVRVECLDYALATRQRHGVWAGTTGEERDRLYRRAR
ncbi:WhiB family transcriptional regulator [Actinomadura craniellae]|uniref:Transcriptional regulator WhiB n=2 Tax=Actinomadura craniellae TaxID=2231787 RepID=A0A365H0E1_9ACTN|nr:WhiB family transcriptional regulator [Actinomadura craniellae]